MKTRIKRKPNKAIKELKRLNKQFRKMPGVLVGLPKGSPTHTSREGEPANIIEIGTYHEFGTGTIPERSFLRSTIFEGKRLYKAFMKKISSKVVEKKISGKEAMGLLGEKLTGDIKTKITDIKTPPLKHKRRLGALENANPLVDTGQLRQAITYITRGK